MPQPIGSLDGLVMPGCRVSLPNARQTKRPPEDGLVIHFVILDFVIWRRRSSPCSTSSTISSWSSCCSTKCPCSWCPRSGPRGQVQSTGQRRRWMRGRQGWWRQRSVYASHRSPKCRIVRFPATLNRIGCPWVPPLRSVVREHPAAGPFAPLQWGHVEPWGYFLIITWKSGGDHVGLLAGFDRSI